MGHRHPNGRFRLVAYLRSILAEAPDHYDLLDRRLVGRLAGVLFLIGSTLATLLLLVEPPTERLRGTGGWVAAAAVVATGVACGVTMLRVRRAVPRVVLLGIGISAPALLGILQWLSGPTSTFDALFGLSVMWAGVVLPGPRLLAVMAWTTFVAAMPLGSVAWAQEQLDRKLINIALLWVLAGACLVWSNRIRGIRRELHEERAAADQLARVDALTALGNRRALEEALTTQVALAGRTGRPLSALVGDLDGFKRINDVHGHHVGDQLLADVAGVLRDVVRTPDACFRWGGDEFVVLLPETERRDAERIAERVAAAVASRCGTPAGEPVGLTLGAATWAEGDTGRQLITDADAALLAAKRGEMRRAG